jgi:hypothetical protein
MLVLTISQFYRPWELLPREEECIKTQIAETEAIIEEEVEEFQRQHPKESGEVSRQDRPAEGVNTNGASKETVGEPRLESPSVSNAPGDTTNNLSAQATQSEQVMAEKPSLEDNNGEVLVEAEEDTVIY